MPHESLYISLEDILKKERAKKQEFKANFIRSIELGSTDNGSQAMTALSDKVLLEQPYIWMISMTVPWLIQSNCKAAGITVLVSSSAELGVTE